METSKTIESREKRCRSTCMACFTEMITPHHVNISSVLDFYRCRYALADKVDPMDSFWGCVCVFDRATINRENPLAKWNPSIRINIFSKINTLLLHIIVLAILFLRSWWIFNNTRESKTFFHFWLSREIREISTVNTFLIRRLFRMKYFTGR